MVRTTRAQREALFKVFQRDFPNWVSPGKRRKWVVGAYSGKVVQVPTTQWRRFRKTVRPLFGDDGCVMLPWHGMWLGIEKDGYTHS
jgi:hypothetical protein